MAVRAEDRVKFVLSEVAKDQRNRGDDRVLNSYEQL
jgi:hypothetical protein